MIGGAELLSLWEAAGSRAAGREQRLLSAAGCADPGALPVGEATRRLLALRVRLAGTSLAGVARCPACGTACEVALDADALAGAAPVQSERAEAGQVEVALQGWRVTARPLTLDDLAAGAACPDADAAERLLAERAVVAVRPPAGTAATEPLPAPLRDAIDAALDALDPLADPRLALACAACGHGWELTFDAARFLADELEARARRLLGEVATLARAFGWSEHEILSLAPERRRLYLELAS